MLGFVQLHIQTALYTKHIGDVGHTVSDGHDHAAAVPDLCQSPAKLSLPEGDHGGQHFGDRKLRGLRVAVCIRQSLAAWQLYQFGALRTDLDHRDFYDDHFRYQKASDRQL